MQSVRVPPVSEAVVAMAVSDADEQRRYLLDAARSVEAHTEGDNSELAAKALHLVACVAAVDSMCRDGDLPGEWQANAAATRRAG